MDCFKDYYLNNKYIGSKICDKDREIFGFMGRVSEHLPDEITLDNKKVIKPNSIVITELQILCVRK